ncbi:iron(III) transport system permease protein [Inhella inkyongensis]|uniref:Iron(III) transport system permease protein n=1 Tax=Inhella inkyongensis TaxID=392593 RepID=A0A840RZT2_9BURK|nr:iron ABC transporter permease [Inhella inkyongensis]MBB5204307.1 iron(III) transport system permease protein [Inhella inkyongensis]
MRLILFLALGLLLALPVLTVLGAWLGLDAAAWAQWRHLASTVLPGYAVESGLLALGVTGGTLLLGGGAAALVSLFEFRGRRFWDLALLLPMAMPAYVAAYAYTDALQPSGALQTALRAQWGLQGALWGEVRSLPGAMLLFTACLYPYVYLLTRTALSERAAPLMEAARLLGAGLTRRMLAVALPLARPALVAGVALALMETLADYGVGSYFGLNTLTTGIYKAWLVNGDRLGAAQLASMLLIVVSLCLMLERRAQAQMRFASSRAQSATDSQTQVLRGRWAWLANALCALPVSLGFFIPVAWLLRMAWLDARYSEQAWPWERFLNWAGGSLKLAALAALLTVMLALVLALTQRLQRGQSLWRRRLTDAVMRLVGLGYAVPGAVIAIGLLLPLAWVQTVWPGAVGWMTGTVLGLLWAYTVRFGGVALQSIEAGYARIPTSLDESARMLGASNWRLGLEVHAPLLTRATLAAALLVFVDVMKELPATLVLRPFDSDTLAVVAYQLARDERLAEAALPALAIVAVGLAPVALLWRSMKLK